MYTFNQYDKFREKEIEESDSKYRATKLKRKHHKKSKKHKKETEDIYRISIKKKKIISGLNSISKENKTFCEEAAKGQASDEFNERIKRENSNLKIKIPKQNKFLTSFLGDEKHFNLLNKNPAVSNIVGQQLLEHKIGYSSLQKHKPDNFEPEDIPEVVPMISEYYPLFSGNRILSFNVD